jgi:hypothetical protein
MRWIADDEAGGRSLEGQFRDAPSGSSNDVRGCAVSSKRTPASCARWHDCTVALRESEKPGEMGDGDFGFAGVKNGLRGTVGLIGVGLRPVRQTRAPKAGGAWHRSDLRMAGRRTRPSLTHPVRRVAVVGVGGVRPGSRTSSVET